MVDEWTEIPVSGVLGLLPNSQDLLSFQSNDTGSANLLQSCPILCDPMDCSLPGSSLHGFSRQEY